MADEAIVREMVRAAVLNAGGHGDAAQAIVGRALDLHLDDISDDLTREIYGFLSGFAACFAALRGAVAAPLVEALQLIAPTTIEMRSAIKAALVLL